MSNFNIEQIIINGYRGAIMKACASIISAKTESNMRKYEAAQRQHAEYLKELEIFNSRAKS